MNGNPEPASRDHDSDPAHTPGHGWVDEGGASHLGPATHVSPEKLAQESDESDVAEQEGDK